MPVTDTSPPAAAAGGGPPQAPMGVSPLTGATPNRGHEAAAMQRLGGIINQLAEIIPMVGATSDIGKAAMDALQKLAKQVPSGANSPASEQADLKKRLMQSQQNMAQTQQMRPQGQPGGQPGMQPGGPPPAQMPGPA